MNAPDKSVPDNLIYDQNLPHPFDAATALHRVGPGRYRGYTSEDYWNQIGPWGGVTAATILRSVLDSPDLLGEPVSIIVNFCAPVSIGEFEVSAREVQSSRNTQHWYVEIAQEGIVATATIVTGVRRSVWSHQPLVKPFIAPPDTLPVLSTVARVAWLRNYEFRFATGIFHPHDAPSETPRSAHSNLWIRDIKLRPIDYVSLTALSDAFFFRVALVRRRVARAGTVSMSTFFHAGAAAISAVGADYIHGVANAKKFSGGFSDQQTELWSPAGELLASSYQVAFYAE
jgi:hypothetical protein